MAEHLASGQENENPELLSQTLAESDPESGLAQEDPEDERIRAKLEFLIFSSSRNPFIIGKFLNMDTKRKFTAKGVLRNASIGRIYLIKGHEVNDPRYGRQIAIDEAEKEEPKPEDAFIRMLTSDQFPGIGKQTARKIWDALGADAVDRILEDPEVLVTHCNLTDERKRIIYDGLKENSGIPKTYMKLVGYGLSDADATRLLSSYENVQKMLDEDCFDPLYHVNQFSYHSTLMLADALDIPKNDIRRLCAALFSQLNQSSFDHGSTWISKEQLFSSYQNIPLPDLEKALAMLVEQGEITQDEDRLYPHDFYRQEWQIARSLKQHSFPVSTISHAKLDEKIAIIEKRENIRYDTKQIDAFKLFFDSSIMILNGGPGTGKSTTVKGILDLIREFFPQSSVQCCAPTGKASKRLEALTGTTSRTIHSLLKWDMENNVFNAQPEDLEFDFLIIDEFSMVDTRLFATLLDLLNKNCRILLIGDEDQLESVSEGNVFADIIASKKIPMVSLTTLYRSESGGGIAELAREIREGEPLVYDNGVEMIEAKDDEILDAISRKASETDYRFSFQVLSPQYENGAGITVINEVLQQLLNPFSPTKNYIKSRHMTWRVDDKVMLLKNMTEEGVYNGDIGTITEIDPPARVVSVRFDDAEIAFKGLKEINESLRHAWCISIHKAQGSEYQDVCVIADPAHRNMLSRKLLYTAISRAKKKLSIIGSRQVFEAGVARTSVWQRQTSLKERIEAVFAGK